jgi:hypothetical protein
MSEKHFVDIYMKSKDCFTYERVDFVPNKEECPEDVYNLFDGFEAEKLASKFPDMTMEKAMKNSKDIIQLFDYLTGGHSDYMMKCLGAIIQTPWNKTQIANYIRDEGELTRSGGGVGKNLAFDFFGNKILGEKYYYVVSDNSELYGSFNGMFEGKLLILVEEASGTDNLKNSAGLKSRITKKKITVNRKGKDQYQLNDYTNYVFTTNQMNAIPVDKNDRRFAIYDANTCMRGNKEYFKSLVKEMENEEVIYSFFYYLKNLKTYDNPVDFKDSVPITSAYRDIRKMNTSPVLRWLSNIETLNKVIKENKGNELYDNYTNWVVNNGEGSGEKLLTQTKFGTMISKSSAFKKEHKKTGNFYIGIAEVLLKDLKEQFLVDDNIVLSTKKEKNNEGVEMEVQFFEIKKPVKG